MKAEPAVTLEVLTAALGINAVTLHRRRQSGSVPPPDACGKCRTTWHLSTLRAWRPDVARRCQAVLKTLKDTPLTAA